MFRLSREVRFAINRPQDHPVLTDVANGYAGYPPLVGFGTFLVFQVTLEGPLNPASSYLVNIKQVDAAVRQIVVPYLEEELSEHHPLKLTQAVAGAMVRLQGHWPGLKLVEATLKLTPFLSVTAVAGETPMVRMSQKFEFSATHRLHNPALSEEENCRTYGKCNNPHGHGHNYELQVTLSGSPDGSGLLIDIPVFERIVAKTVIDRFDHRNLNVELPEFRERVPTVENIAMTIFRLLRAPLKEAGGALASVTVWETPKTWCEYSE